MESIREYTKSSISDLVFELVKTTIIYELTIKIEVKIMDFNPFSDWSAVDEELECSLH